MTYICKYSPTKISYYMVAQNKDNISYQTHFGERQQLI